MSFELSDDDDSFAPNDSENNENVAPPNSISISSDDETQGPPIVYELTSDEEPPITVEIQKKKQALIRNLFPNTKSKFKNAGKEVTPAIIQPKHKGIEKMIGGIKIHLPVEPYGSQTALMFKVITAINKSQNCLLESPTGSGKTLALLCSALAWVRHERKRVSDLQAQEFVAQHAEVKEVHGAAQYVSVPTHDETVTAENFFKKPVFGQKNIYDVQLDSGDFNSGASKRQEPLDRSLEEKTDDGLVKIHKKRRYNDNDAGSSSCIADNPELSLTPEKKTDPPQPETPQSIRRLYDLVDNLRLRASMLVDYSVPTVYYGARTHKQLQQVVREFARTDYCGDALMTILSSRDYSCIREFDRQMWSTRNDMCRSCVKPFTSTSERRNDSNCKYYDNRMALNHRSLPPAFDLEELVAAGGEMKACPYFAARAMVANAHIVFCPYNYLIEPSIRSSMQIDLEGNILIIDEAHNIEDICRDAATFTITKDNVLAALKELETVAGYRFANQDAMNYVEFLLQTLKNWDQWFSNQKPLIEKQAVSNNEAVFTWEVKHFVETLNNHNIGQQQYSEFRQNAEMFCRRLREDPRTLYGVTQSTGSLIESIDIVLGYLFRCSGKYMDDFKPALIRNVWGAESLGESVSWRHSQFNKAIDRETLSLRLMCMNPAVVFEGLKSARCIILASGTLTPLLSLHSELATEFPLQVSPNHVIPADRVWVGTVGTGPGGARLECSSRAAAQVGVKDSLGHVVLAVAKATPHGVLCFLPSYHLMNTLLTRWKETDVWRQLNDLKHVFMESRNVKDHNDIMEDYYKYVSTSKGAILFAVYRGKVSEGMDFKDHQARAVITVGIPYPNTYDMAVKEKMHYNDRYAADRNLLSSSDWLLVQAYRALNQAVGRCVRHRNDWGAVLMVDARFSSNYYTKHLSKWVRNFLGNNHHTFESLVNSPNGIATFMQNMTIRESEDV